MRYCVSYSERSIREIIVEANSEEEAERMVMDGDVDYDESSELDAEIININSSEYLDG
jgi:hypothetical protein